MTRELLYTAVTRAQERLIVVGTEEAIRAAVERPITRASGLRPALWGEDQGLTPGAMPGGNRAPPTQISCTLGSPAIKIPGLTANNRPSHSVDSGCCPMMVDMTP